MNKRKVKECRSKHFVDLQASYASLGNQRGYFYTESDDTEYGKVTIIGSAKVIKHEDGIKKAHSMGQSIRQKGSVKEALRYHTRTVNR